MLVFLISNFGNPSNIYAVKKQQKETLSRFVIQLKDADCLRQIESKESALRLRLQEAAINGDSDVTNVQTEIILSKKKTFYLAHIILAQDLARSYVKSNFNASKFEQIKNVITPKELQKLQKKIQ